jgi:hypothetical protein
MTTTTTEMLSKQNFFTRRLESSRTLEVLLSHRHATVMMMSWITTIFISVHTETHY